MKNKLSLIAAMLAVCTFAVAQDYTVDGKSIVFTKVIENTGKNIPEAHDALESFFALRYNDVNSTQKLNQPDHLIYKGLFTDVCVHTMGMFINDVSHTVDVSIKDNRVRVKIIANEYVCRSTQGNGTSYCDITDYSPISDKNTYFFKKTAIKTFDEMCVRVNALFADIENSLRNTATEEDW